MARNLLRVALAILCVVSIVLSAATLPFASVGGNATNGTGDQFGSFGSPGDQGIGAPENQSLVEEALNQSVDEAGIVTASNQNEVGGPIGEGTPGELSAEVMFTVDADRPTYMREGAYVTYTGSGWERPDDAEPLQGAVYPDAEGDRLVQTVTAKSTMTVVPTAWKPVTVEGAAAEGTSVTPRGGLRVSEPIAENETYTVVSRLDRPSPDELRGLGSDYPTDVEATYTALPDSLPDRVAERTDEITAGSDDPYEQAAAIEAWLEANKEYDLNASQPEGDFVDGFLFEMEKGYCEYFATSMVVMLRTQGIPARYVTGFSPGQPGDDGYVVRGMNAHAWVEVYFPEEGWVRFDPTPPAERLQTEQSALEEARSSGEQNVDLNGTENQTYDPEHSTSPGEVNGTDGNLSDGNESDLGDVEDPGGTDGNETSGNETDSDPPDDSETQEDPSLNVSVEPDPAPGREVTVTVTRDGQPVPDVEVYFNDELVGVTDENGQVTARVPYTSDLTITVVEPAESQLVAVPPPGGGAAALGVPPPGDAVRYDVDRADDPLADDPDNESNESSETFELDTDATVTVEGATLPGNRVTVLAAFDGRPLPNANVSVGGRFVGTTDAEGRITIALPFENETTVAVQRGEVTGETTVGIASDASLSVESRLVPNETVLVRATVGDRPLGNAPVAINGTVVGETNASGYAEIRIPYRDPVRITVGRESVTAAVVRPLDAPLRVTTDGGDYPGDEITVRATVDGDPVAGVAVTLGNDTVATTGPNGEATVTAPFRNSVEIEASRGDVTVSKTVDWILLPVGLAGSLSLGYVALVLARRYFGVAEAYPVYPGEILGATLSAVILVAAWAARRAEGVRAAVRALRDHFERSDSVGEFLRTVAAAARAGLRARWATLRGWIAARRGGTQPDEAVFEEAVDEVIEEASREGATVTIEDAWERMVARLDVPNPDARTPGEYARWAIDAGMPAAEVKRLTRVFRDAEYGPEPPDESDGEAATAAIEGIERGLGEPSDRGPDPAGGDD